MPALVTVHIEGPPAADGAGTMAEHEETRAAGRIGGLEQLSDPCTPAEGRRNRQVAAGANNRQPPPDGGFTAPGVVDACRLLQSYIECRWPALTALQHDACIETVRIAARAGNESARAVLMQLALSKLPGIDGVMNVLGCCWTAAERTAAALCIIVDARCDAAALQALHYLTDAARRADETAKDAMIRLASGRGAIGRRFSELADDHTLRSLARIGQLGFLAEHLDIAAAVCCGTRCIEVLEKIAVWWGEISASDAAVRGECIEALRGIALSRLAAHCGTMHEGNFPTPGAKWAPEGFAAARALLRIAARVPVAEAEQIVDLFVQNYEYALGRLLPDITERSGDSVLSALIARLGRAALHAPFGPAASSLVALLARADSPRLNEYAAVELAARARALRPGHLLSLLTRTWEAAASPADIASSFARHTARIVGAMYNELSSEERRLARAFVDRLAASGDGESALIAQGLSGRWREAVCAAKEIWRGISGFAAAFRDHMRS